MLKIKKIFWFLVFLLPTNGTKAQVGVLTGWGMAICQQYSFNVCPGQTITPLNYGNQYFVCTLSSMADVSFVNQGPGWRVARHNWFFVSSGASAQITGTNQSNNSITWTFAAGAVLSPSVYTVVGGIEYITFSVNNALIPFTVRKDNFQIQLTNITPLAVNSVTLCSGQSATLTATGSANYLWLPGNLTSQSIVVSPLSTAVYTVTSSNGNCPNSVAQSTVNVTPTPTIALVASSTLVCSGNSVSIIATGASTYTWQNVNLTGGSLSITPLATTIYTVIGANNSCTVASVMTISVNQTPTLIVSTSSPTLCSGTTATLSVSGATTYTWNPGNLAGLSVLVNPQTTTVYTVIGFNGVCNTTKQLTLNVVATPTVSVASTSTNICSGNSVTLTANGGATYTWLPSIIIANAITVTPLFTTTYTVHSANGLCIGASSINVSVNTTPTLMISAATQTLCAGKSTTLSASGASSYFWYPGNQIGANITVNPLSTIVYTVTGLNGVCTDTKTLIINVATLPTPTALSNGPACEGQSMIFGVNNPGQFFSIWHGPSGFISTLKSFTIPSVSLSNSGVYTVLVTGANSCSTSISLTASIFPKPVLTAYGATVCLNSPANISASGATFYSWYNTSGPVGSSASLLISNTQQTANTIYYVIGTSANSCTSSANATLSILPLPSPGLTLFPKNKVCLNSQIALEGFGGNTYHWQGPGNTYFTGKTLTLTAYNIFMAGEYTLTVTDNLGCKNYTDTIILIDELPNGSITADTRAACVPFCSEFRFYPSTEPSSLTTMSWEFNRNTYSGQTFSYCFKEPGNYVITANIKDAGTSCTNTINFSVTAFPKPLANFDYSPSTPVEAIEDVAFTNKSIGEQQTKWDWFFIGDKTTYMGEQISYSYNKEGDYLVAMIVENKWGCLDSIVKIIKVEPDFQLFVPNAFTPNGDIKNEVFLPVVRGAKLYNLIVFNRWGENIFESNEPLNGWDGTFKGAPCQSDIYVWKISASGINGEVKEKMGEVLLMR